MITKRLFKGTVALVLGGALGACTHSGNVGTAPAPMSCPSEDCLNSDLQGFYDALAASGFTDPNAFPANPASYDGTVVLVKVDQTYYGVLAMDVDFAAMDFTGDMTGFKIVDLGGGLTDVNGSFDFVNGKLTGENSLFDSALTGTAQGTLDGVNDVMTVSGAFAGANADSVAIILDGTNFSGYGVAN